MGLNRKQKPSPWTEEENEILLQYYPSEGGNVQKRILNHSKAACVSRAGALGIKFIPKAKKTYGKSSYAKWTKEEDAILEKYYQTEGRKVVERLPGRTPETCRSRASKRGIAKNKPVSGRRWTKEEDDILHKYYPIEGKNVVKRFENRTSNSCWLRASLLGLKAPVNKWTDKEEELLREHYEQDGSKVCAKLIGRTASACMAHARIMRMHDSSHSKKK